MQKALIIGGWWVGSVVWAWLEKDNWYSVDILMKSWFQTIQSIYHHNLVYHPHFNYITTDSSWGIYDLVVIATKVVDVDRAHAQAKYFLIAWWSLITIQSGLHEYILDYPYHAKAVAYVNVHKHHDTVTMLSDTLRLILEDATIPWIHNLNTTSDYVSLELVDTIESYIWEKLVHISAFAGIICETWKTIWVVRDDKILYVRYLALLDECLLVANHLWYHFDRSRFEQRIQSTPADVYTSLYHDLVQGKKNEYQFLLGRIYALAHQYHLSVPLIDEIHTAITTQYLS